MDAALLSARVALALVFAVAGLAKLADLKGSREAVRGFGVPAGIAAPVAHLLPLTELTTAVALLPATSAWWAAVAALALLAGFVVAIGVNVLRGNAPDCHCFGQLHSSPAGLPTLARTGALAAVAGFVASRPGDAGPSAVAWVGDLSGIEAAALAAGALVATVLAIHTWLLAQLLKQNGRLLTRLEALETGVPREVPQPAHGPGLPVGSLAPEFALTSLDGGTVSLGELRAPGLPLLLFFMSPGCGPCKVLLPDIARWQAELAEKIRAVVVSSGDVAANRALADDAGVEKLLLQANREVMDAYQAAGTPSAVLVSGGGTIASHVAQGAEGVRALVARSAAAGTPSPVTPCPSCGKQHVNGTGAAPAQVDRVGEAAPAVALPDLDGNEVGLASFRGSPTLVLFWNPGCGFCRQMLAELQAWEKSPGAGAPKLLLVSTGTPDANREMGLRSPIVLEDGFVAGRAFGASGTPSAVLVDAEGRIASPVAVGATGVMELARLSTAAL